MNAARVKLMRAMAPATLHTSEFYRVERLFGGRILRVVRLRRPFTSEEDVDVACTPVQDALDTAGRSSHALLIDTRLVDGRNDPSSERAFSVHRAEMVKGFRACAILVQTATGKLQSDRLLRQDHARAVRVFLDEGEALLYLDGAPALDRLER